MQIIIPNQLSISPREFGTKENNFSRFKETPPKELFISADGHQWLEWRSQGLNIDELMVLINIHHVNHLDGTTETKKLIRYRKEAVELFFELADSIKQ